MAHVKLVALLALGIASTAFAQKRPRVDAELLATTQSEFDVVVVYEDDDDDNSRRGREDKVRNMGGKNHRHHAAIGVGTLRANRALLEELKKDGKIRSIGPDRKVSAAAAGSTQFAPAKLRTTAGLTTTVASNTSGDGVGVAVIDSGVSNVAALGNPESCGASRIVYSQNFASDSGTNDLYGHGTHVASILGASATCDGSAQNGVAPEVKIINLRVLNSFGMGTDSGVVAAIDRAIQLKSTYNIRVINLSLGRGVTQSFINDPLCQAVERAWKAGIVVVTAAGNMGRDNSHLTQGYATISVPGADPFVITVGAVRDPNPGGSTRTDDTITSYSSKGPTLVDRVVKPDLVAPGNMVVARTVFPSTLTTLFAGNTTYLDGSTSKYFMLSGTSMAAPAVAGAAALLIERDSTLTPDQVKARLMKTAWKGMAATASVYDSLTNSNYNIQQDLFTVGAGYLDIAAALASTEKIGSTKSAISPRVVKQSNGKVVLTKTYSNLTGLNVVWGTNVIWGDNVIWGNNLLLANNVIWGDNVIWGANVSSGYNVIWGDNVIWGECFPFSVALTASGDK